jgi:hypothetical protein
MLAQQAVSALATLPYVAYYLLLFNSMLHRYNGDHGY